MNRGEPIIGRRRRIQNLPIKRHRLAGLLHACVDFGDGPAQFDIGLIALALVAHDVEHVVEATFFPQRQNAQAQSLAFDFLRQLGGRFPARLGPFALRDRNAQFVDLVGAEQIP